MKKLIFIKGLLAATFITTLHSEAPQVITGIVIDQGAAHYITRFGNLFQHGIRRFLDQGMVFTNAHYPYAAPVTATGHATLSTGCLPAKHGIIMNTWYSPEGKLTASVEDDREEASVLDAKGSCDCKASSHTIMVPSISDIASEASTETFPYHVYSLSFKDRAAIGMGGHKGKAIWFDEHQQAFTSNYEYFDALPRWVKTFNAQLGEKIKQARTWNLFFDPSHEVYKNYAKEIYHLSTVPGSIAGTKLGVMGDWKKLQSKKNFMLAPQSNAILFDLALHCLDQVDQDTSAPKRTLLWVSLSSLDKVGHMYGPHSMEAIDTLMHMDKIIGDFINTVETRYGKGNVLFFLTADHGVSPIPENMSEENYRPAKRIIMHKVVKNLNSKIKEEFGIKELFFGFKTNQLFWNEKKLQGLSKSELYDLVKFIKRYLSNLEGIKKVWTFNELASSKSVPGSFKTLFKNQLYKGRSGAFFLLGKPFVMLTNYDKGSCHRTPYNHDTHVPLMFLCPGKIAHTKVRNKVWTTQLAPSLAKVWKLKTHKDMESKSLPKMPSFT